MKSLVLAPSFTGSCCSLTKGISVWREAPNRLHLIFLWYQLASSKFSFPICPWRYWAVHWMVFSSLQIRASSLLLLSFISEFLCKLNILRLTGITNLTECWCGNFQSFQSICVPNMYSANIFFSLLAKEVSCITLENTRAQLTLITYGSGENIPISSNYLNYKCFFAAFLCGFKGQK